MIRLHSRSPRSRGERKLWQRMQFSLHVRAPPLTTCGGISWSWTADGWALLADVDVVSVSFALFWHPDEINERLPRTIQTSAGAIIQVLLIMSSDKCYISAGSETNSHLQKEAVLVAVAMSVIKHVCSLDHSVG